MLRATTIHPGDELVTLPEAARIIGVSPPTLKLWAFAGRLPAQKAGRVLFFRRADVEAYRATREHNAAVSA